VSLVLTSSLSARRTTLGEKEGGKKERTDRRILRVCSPRRGRRKRRKEEREREKRTQYEAPRADASDRPDYPTEWFIKKKREGGGRRGRGGRRSFLG